MEGRAELRDDGRGDLRGLGKEHLLQNDVVQANETRHGYPTTSNSPPAPNRRLLSFLRHDCIRLPAYTRLPRYNAPYYYIAFLIPAMIDILAPVFRFFSRRV